MTDTERLDRIRQDLDALIDSTDHVENTALHASPERRAAQRQGNAYRNALTALRDAS